MKQQKHMEAPAAPRWKYWTSAPETVVVPVEFLEPLVPAANRVGAFPRGTTVSLPASEIFSANVPRLRLVLLERLLPGSVRAKSDESIPLSAQKLAGFYSLVQHAEEIQPVEPVHPGVVENAEPAADPIPAPAPPEVAPAPVVDSIPPVPVPPAEPEPPSAEAPAWEDPALKFAPKPGRRLFSGLPIFRRRSEVEPVSQPEVPRVPAEPVKPAEPEAALPSPPKAPAHPPKPRAVLPPLKAMPTIRPPRAVGAMTEIPPPPPPAAPVFVPAGVVEPETPVESKVPAEPVVEPEPVHVARIPDEPVEPPRVAVVDPPARVEEPEATIPTPIRPAVRVLDTEAVTGPARRDLPDEEGLQALFLTEENLTIPRVVELCGGLPGINSCVLTHGSVVITAHNAPTNVDLISLSAHAADMLRAMRESTARMGVGTVPAVTLHTEKGVISFFSREDLTMLVFHKDRGFVPGVREKIAAALGELTKAHLTLPAGEAGK